MKAKKKNKKLGSLSSGSAVSLLQDKELRAGIVQAQKNSFQVLKWTGIAVAGVIATIVITKQIKKAIRKSKSKREAQEIADTVNSKNLTHNNAFYVSQANKLYEALDPLSKTETFQNYDEDKIMEVLKSLKNVDEWNQVIKEFGTRKNNPTDSDLNLMEFLRKDDAGDRKKYNQILTQIGVSNLI